LPFQRFTTASRRNARFAGRVSSHAPAIDRLTEVTSFEPVQPHWLGCLSRDLFDLFVARAGSNCRWPMLVLFNMALQRRLSSASISLQRCRATIDFGEASRRNAGGSPSRWSRLASRRRPVRVLSLFADAPRSFGFGGGPDRTPLVRFLSRSAFTGRVALSGAAGIRTIPLRRCGLVVSCGVSPERPGRAFRRPRALAVFRFFTDS
jgi:hypothetical protein